MSNQKSNLGCIKWFDPKKGFGFLTDINDEKDVFVHYSSIVTESEVYKTLYSGEYVSYDSKLDDKDRTVTTKVTGVQGGKLLCENDSFQKRGRTRKED